MNRLLPHIERENQKIANDRARLITLAGKLPLTAEERAHLRSLAKSYRIPVSRSDGALIDALLQRVDKLPPSLVLAQAAIESAWGTSRFAREGNNLFGQWCYSAGCGIVPARRDATATHEVKRFRSLEESVHGYFMNINSNRAYRSLWALRSCHRSQGQPLSGTALAEGLVHYSEVGERYVETVRKVINANRWESLDHAQQQLALTVYGESQCPGDNAPDLRGSLVLAGE